MSEMRSKIEMLEKGQSSEVNGMQEALANATKANAKVQENLEKQKMLIANLEKQRSELTDELTNSKRDKLKVGALI